jgi:hypothetical protein
MVVGCRELSEAFDDYPGCCDSCHEDEAEFGYDMCEATIGTVLVRACCRVVNWIHGTERAWEQEILDYVNANREDL